jgi:hypothetical protein
MDLFEFKLDVESGTHPLYVNKTKVEIENKMAKKFNEINKEVIKKKSKEKDVNSKLKDKLKKSLIKKKTTTLLNSNMGQSS